MEAWPPDTLCLHSKQHIIDNTFLVTSSMHIYIHNYCFCIYYILYTYRTREVHISPTVNIHSFSSWKSFSCVARTALGTSGLKFSPVLCSCFVKNGDDWWWFYPTKKREPNTLRVSMIGLHRIKHFESIVGKGTLSSADSRWTLEQAPTASSAYVRLCCSGFPGLLVLLWKCKV